MKVLYREYVSTRKLPGNIQVQHLNLFEAALKFKINDTKVERLKNIFILYDSVFSLKKVSFYQSYTHIHKLPFRTLIKRLLGLLRKGERIKNAVWIFDEWSDNYFHWFTDALPRLLAAEKSYSFKEVLLPKSFERYSYISSSLSLLGYQPHYITKKIFVNELILPNHTAATGNYNRELVNEVREKFLLKNISEADKKIYISREMAKIRRVLNERELTEILKKFNYEIHYFENYTLEKQISIMAETKILVSLHGAGLTNMLFMRKNGKVLEIRSENDNHNNCYFSLASELGLDYYYELGSSEKEDIYDADITVNLKSFEKNLALIS